MADQLPLFSRVPEEKRPGLKIGDRDLTILKAVMKCRFITSTQLKALLWSIPERSLQSRLKKLYHNGFLNRPSEQRVLRIMEGLTEIIYSLGDRGVDLLARHLGLDKAKLKWQANSANSSYLKHSLMITEFRITLTLATEGPEERTKKKLGAWKRRFKAREGAAPPPEALRARKEKISREETEKRQDLIHRFYMKGLEADVKLVSWKKGKQLNDSSFYEKSSGVKEQFPVSPDGYFVLSFPNLNKKDCWFFEADRGTESANRFQKKLRSYWNYKTSRAGRRARKKKEVPDYRVLTVTEKKGRRDYLRKAARNCGIEEKAYHTFWFGTKEDYQIGKPETVFGRKFLTPAGEEKKSLLPER